MANGRLNRPKGATKQETVVRTDRPIVVDATDHIAGRLSSNVAKLLLQGNRVSIVNCEKIMISGTRSNIIKEYRDFLEISSILNPKHGPFHPRRPDTIITKMIRGMLPHGKKPSGVEAHRRLRAYIGSPKELKSLEKIQFEKAKIKKSASNYTTMGELGRVIGWTE
ncbi:MAG: 50S ribosomal protein L13 [Nitrosopumilus sp. (ex Thoosa mismalolli)]|nr:50S ribosomal protein L13 [Nitrosopumilus sp. (ex Thoosa mismalolli)]